MRPGPVSLTSALAAVALAVPGCHRGTESATERYVALVRSEAPAVERAVGVPFKHPPRVEARTRAQLRDYLVRQLEDTAELRDLMGSATAYKLLGMIPDTLDVQKLFLDLYTEQVIGFYDPRTKVLYVVSGAPENQLRITIGHELVHALQDQYVSLDSIQRSRGADDRKLAAQAVIEGQATFDQLRAMLGPGNVAVNLPGGWDRVREMIRNSRDAMPVYSAAPLVIQETIIFPYLSGAEYVRAFSERFPHTEPWTRFPVSTEQVLHPRNYFTSPADTPLVVRITPRGVTPSYENDMGEFETRLFLYQGLGHESEAIRGAAGWGGDRYVVWGPTSDRNGALDPRSASIAWATAWDTPADAAEFYAMAQRIADSRPKNSGRRTTVSTALVAGRPVVLIVDTPAASPAGAVTVADVSVGGTR